MPTQFSSPGYEMSQAILQEMARRQAIEQQEFQNSIATQRETRADEQVKLQREQEARVAAQQKQTADALQQERESDRAVQIEDRLLPGVVSPATAAMLRKNNLGESLSDQMTLPGKSINQPAGVSVGESTPAPAVPGVALPQEPTGRVVSSGGAKWQTAEAAREATRISRENALEAKAEGREENNVAAMERVLEGARNRAHATNLAAGARADTKALAQSNNDRNLFIGLTRDADRSPLIKAGDRTVLLEDAITQIEKDPKNPSAQMNLGYGFVQINDTYQSAVRSEEIRMLGDLASKWDSLKVTAGRYFDLESGKPTGAFMPPSVATEIAATSKRMIKAVHGARETKMKEFQARAKVAGVGPLWDSYLTEITPPQAKPGSDKVTETDKERAKRLYDEVIGKEKK